MDTHPQPFVGDRYIVGLRFQRVGKIYHFDASDNRDLQPGDYAVVDTSRGRQLGQMILVVHQPDPNADSSLKPILRRATPQDLLLKKSWEQKEAEALVTCQQKASELGYKDVKIVVAEFSFDGSRLYFLYSSEEGEKTELKSLRRALQKIYPQTHIEMHMIGPRDVAKIMGGMGACGLDMRCCSAFLADFSPISIKMAKEQGISLTPTEITGMCGRLRCCMVYEYPQYVDARKQLPKRGRRVDTPKGMGKITDVLALKGSVMVELDSGGQHEYLATELQLTEEHESIKKTVLNSSTAHLMRGSDSSKKDKKKKQE